MEVFLVEESQDYKKNTSYKARIIKKIHLTKLFANFIY